MFQDQKIKRTLTILLTTIFFSLVLASLPYFVPIFLLAPVGLTAMVAPGFGYLLDTKQEQFQIMTFTASLPSSAAVYGMNEMPKRMEELRVKEYRFNTTGEEVFENFDLNLGQMPNVSAIISFESTQADEEVRIGWTFEPWIEQTVLKNEALPQENVHMLKPFSQFKLPLNRLKNGKVGIQIDKPLSSSNYSVVFVTKEVLYKYDAPEKNQIKSYNNFEKSNHFNWHFGKGRYLLFLSKDKTYQIEGRGRWTYPKQFIWDLPMFAIVLISLLASLYIQSLPEFYFMKKKTLLPLVNSEKL